MADEVFKQSRRKITVDEIDDGNPLDSVKKVQEAVAKETGRDVAKPFGAESAPFAIEGNMPPEFKRVMQNKQSQEAPSVRVKADDDEGFDTFEAPPEKPRPQSRKSLTPDAKVRAQGTDELENLLNRLAEHHSYEPFTWPSKGRFYSDIPETVSIRAMTGEEEQILSTPRFVKKGKAIDMIFRRCIKEPINTENLLSVDRNHLLIFLRGISYTPEYDVEIKCPNCSMKFPTVIDLNNLEVEECPGDFGPDNLTGVLPASGFRYSYRLATGQDEMEISNYRQKRLEQWGDQSEDDTMLYRTALLLEDIEGVTMKKELALLLKKLPIQDVAHLRNEINQPPFGVDTTVDMMCPSCNEEFKIDLPLETNFFFPRKKEKIPA
jgi:hypothetical protein